MLKRTYKAENGDTRYTLEFFHEAERDLAARRIETWNEKMLQLFTIGHELLLNGRSLQSFGDSWEARIRETVGGELISWGQILLMQNEDEELIEGLRRLVHEMDLKKQKMEDEDG